MLSPDEIDRRLRTELGYMPPTSKVMGPSRELPQGTGFETPPRGAFAKSFQPPPVPPLPVKTQGPVGGTTANKMGQESSGSGHQEGTCAVLCGHEQPGAEVRRYQRSLSSGSSNSEDFDFDGTKGWHSY